jgi:hypothetical protein
MAPTIQWLQPIATDSGVLVWATAESGTGMTIGGILDGQTGNWTLIHAPAPIVLGDGPVTPFWALSKLWVWSGNSIGAGATWNPVDDTWSAMPSGGPVVAGMPAEWTGTEAIFWNPANSRGWIFHP